MPFQTIKQLKSNSMPTITMAVGGLPKSGKTAFCLGAPRAKRGDREGIYVHVFDPGSKATLEKLADDSVRIAYYLDEVQEVLTQSAGRGDHPEAAQKLLARFEKDYYKESILKGRTVVVDDGTVLWDVIRMATFGRLEQVPQLQYVQANKVFRNLAIAAFTEEVNLLMPHKIKEVWGNVLDSKGKPVKDKGRTLREATGRYELAGCDAALYYIQTSGIASKDRCRCALWHGGACAEGVCACKSPCGADGEFHLRIEQNAPEPAFEGVDFSGEDLKFPAIASILVPGTEESDWL